MYAGKTFYHKTIRNYTTMMGSLFNDISIQRMDKDNNVVKIIEVPIAYAAKEEYIRFIREGFLQDPLTDDDPTNDDMAQVQIVLPRMSFELTTINYASDRMQSVMHQLRYAQEGEAARMQHMPTAYDFIYDVNIYAKHMDDALQVLEQILPYFNPTVNWPVDNLPQMDGDITHDIAIELLSVNPQIEYQGSAADEDRLIIFSLSFTLRGYLFRPTGDQDLIKKAIANFKDLNDFGEELEDQFTQVTITSEVDPETAGPEDPHTIETTTEDFIDC